MTPERPAPRADGGGAAPASIAHRSIDEYIASFPPDIQVVLQQIRTTIATAAPGATETLSYRMPCFVLDGALVYFGAFSRHIGFYPPVRDEELRRDAAAFAGPNGNLRFPLDQPMPYALIGRIVQARVCANRERAAARRQKRRAPAG